MKVSINFEDDILAMCPKINDRYSLRIEDDQDGFLYDFEEDSLKVLNKSAVYILGHIDGVSTVESILMRCLNYFLDKTNSNFTEVTSDTLDFIDNLEKRGVIRYVQGT